MSDKPSPSHDDDLVTLVTKPTEFEAETLVAVLDEAGIKAVSYGTPNYIYPLTVTPLGVPVQVRRVDLERAQAAIKQNVADSVDLDWDEVDVGQPQDDAEPTDAETRRAHEPPSPTSMPLIAKLGFLLAVVLVVLMLAMFVAMVFRAWP
jgi:type III secretory pathway lipoprotein EscJ